MFVGKTSLRTLIFLIASVNCIWTCAIAETLPQTLSFRGKPVNPTCLPDSTATGGTDITIDLKRCKHSTNTVSQIGAVVTVSKHYIGNDGHQIEASYKYLGAQNGVTIALVSVLHATIGHPTRASTLWMVFRRGSQLRTIMYDNNYGCGYMVKHAVLTHDHLKYSCDASIQDIVYSHIKDAEKRNALAWCEDPYSVRPYRVDLDNRRFVGIELPARYANDCVQGVNEQMIKSNGNYYLGVDKLSEYIEKIYDTCVGPSSHTSFDHCS